ncbi:MAG: DUF853 family protein [Candidatus Micrarchaeota archaeon]|nr:DUF853 family protein [Candidatus Micrarchaeota archaeon]
MKRYLSKIDFATLPQPGPDGGFLGLIAETNVRAFVDFQKLTMHTLVAGGSGSGKTVAAQVIAEEALKKGIAVVVFDPTAQWSGFLRPQKNREMLAAYKKFGMSLSEARAFDGNIVVVKNADQQVDLKKLTRPGEITVFVTSRLTPQQVDSFYANTVKQVFASQPEESPKLKVLFVYDEVHRLLPKFGGSGEGLVQIERAAREYRKWGLGLVLISQVLSDFVGEIKANISTEIQMRTKYEGDLERIRTKFGDETARSIVRSAIGSGMMHNPEYNRGAPYFVTYRALQHNIVRLSETELQKYDEYNQRIEVLEEKVAAIKAKGVDVLDLELELNIVRDKLKKGAFNIVDIYMESLTQKVETQAKKHGV